MDCTEVPDFQIDSMYKMQMSIGANFGKDEGERLSIDVWLLQSAHSLTHTLLVLRWWWWWSVVCRAQHHTTC